MRFYGEIGYGDSVETSAGSGVYEDVIVARNYKGTIVRNTRQTPQGDHLNNDITVNNSIEVLADAYALNHFFSIRYAKWQGVYWEVTDVEVRRPRLILRLGGVYNGPTSSGIANPPE